MRWGAYDHFEDFFAIHSEHQRLERDTEEASLPLSARRARRRQSNRDVVEVEVQIEEILPNDEQGARHQLLRVKVISIIENDPDAEADLMRCLNTNDTVCIAIRYGDRQGLPAPIGELSVGMRLQVGGEWIPESRARGIGGEAASVLHFTHHPVGFVCTPTDCYS